MFYLQNLQKLMDAKTRLDRHSCEKSKISEGNIPFRHTFVCLKVYQIVTGLVKQVRSVSAHSEEWLSRAVA